MINTKVFNQQRTGKRVGDIEQSMKEKFEPLWQIFAQFTNRNITQVQIVFKGCAKRKPPQVKKIVKEQIKRKPFEFQKISVEFTKRPCASVRFLAENW